MLLDHDPAALAVLKMHRKLLESARVGTKQVPGVAPPTTPYFFSLPERSRQEKAPHRLARCAGSLRPADVWRADKNSLRSDI
ncbi:MAG: hypothetical protein Q7U44_07205, partial [Desulfuromonadales bacterium]|nr:hypothetical protein [Desulfuromonadales bacterium]